jgi:hypothetical protein
MPNQKNRDLPLRNHTLGPIPEGYLAPRFGPEEWEDA